MSQKCRKMTQNFTNMSQRRHKMSKNVTKSAAGAGAVIKKESFQRTGNITVRQDVSS